MSPGSTVAVGCCLMLVALAASTGAEDQAPTTANGAEFTIVAPQQLRINAPYRVAVSVHSATVEASQFSLEISNGGEFSLSQRVTVQPLSTELVRFDIGRHLPAPAPGRRYKLIAECLHGAAYRNATELRVSDKQFSFLVQSDKATYKPGDLVRFRVIAIDADTRPFPLDASLNVHVEDGSSNRLRQWSNVSTNGDGVFEADFRLSDQPVLGLWRLSVEALREHKDHQFYVEEYVLPTFEASIETDANVLLRAGTIRANVRARYTFGKPVHGEARVTIRALSFVASKPRRLLAGGKTKQTPMVADGSVRKVLPVQGAKASFECDLVDELPLKEETTQTLQLELEFEEAFTGRVQRASTTVTVHRDEFSISKLSYAYNYMDGVPFGLEFAVIRFDGTPVRGETVTVQYSSDLADAAESHSLQLKTDAEGAVRTKIDFPPKRHGFFVMAKYAGISSGFGYYPSAIYRHPSEPDFGLTVLGERFDEYSVGEKIRVELNVAEAVQFYTYQVITRGNVAESKTVRVGDGSKDRSAETTSEGSDSDEDEQRSKYIIEFEATFEMAPTVRLVVYTIRANQTVDVANVHINVRTNLTSHLTLTPSINETEPGTFVDLRIETPPQSSVYLLGIDQKVLLLRTGNDLNVGDVNIASEQYNSLELRPAFPEPSDASWRRSYEWSETQSTFENVGLVVLSNLPAFIKYPLDTSFHKYGLHANRYAASPQAAFAADGGFIREPAVRKDFPDTWLWDRVHTESGDESVSFKVPDSITSWVITGFSLNAQKGFGLTETAAKLNVLKKFFVSVDLPYKVKRDEVLAVPITVFNYLGEAVEASVTLHNELGEFEFVDISNDIDSVGHVDTERSAPLLIKSDDASGLTMLIKPIKVGQLTLKITATSSTAGDGVELLLLVEPEGVPQYTNRAVFVDLRTAGSFETSPPIDLSVPEQSVPDSARTEVTLIGDVLGSTVKNLARLIYMPSGCGEQNMLHFVPNIVVRNYLRTVKQLDADTDATTKQYLEIGYQRQLSYRHYNGSYSAFGRQFDASGSTWLTAFVARSFRAAAEHIDIEPRLIEQALDFLRYTQADNGSFVEVGSVIHRQMQGGARSDVALTAYTLLAFVENRHAFPNHTDVIDRATAYLVGQLGQLNNDDDDDLYATAVAAYALTLTEHAQKDELLGRLDARAIVDGDRTHWALAGSGDESSPNSLNIELTAYVLLAKFLSGPVEPLVPVMRWLLSQRNAHGGFQSTQDTVVGLQALAAIAGRLSFDATELEFAFGEGDAASTLTLNAGNAQVLQQFVVPRDQTRLHVAAKGHGFALLSVSTRYYVNDTAARPRFAISASLNDTGEHPDALAVHVCTHFLPGEAAASTNMAVMEMDFPSGFAFNGDSKPGLLANGLNVRRVETRRSDTQVVVYFERLDADVPVCLQFAATRTHRVAHQKAAAIAVYDYYDTARKSRVFYNGPATGLCALCAAGDCPAAC